MQLTYHFSLREFTRSERAVRLGIDNTPTKEALANLKILANHLELIRDLVGRIDITSGYRSPALNRATPNASQTSAHCLGLAADIEAPDYAKGNVKALCKLVASMETLPFDQVIYECGPDGWCHVGFAMGKPRRQVLTKRAVRKPGEPLYLPGLVD